MFYKEIDAGSWAGLDNYGTFHFLPYRKQGGMTMRDRRSFFCKTAASERFLDEIDNIKLGSGDIPVHVVAIGATEFFSSNRKGDAFNERTCKQAHHTFVTHGRNYSHHRNSDPRNSFGKIAASCYNDSMHRIELLVVSNGNEEAARRNGGKVLPDEFLSRIEKYASVPVSMGCDIRADVCAFCCNNARRREEYCTSETCRDPKTGEHFFGCREGLGKVTSDGRVQYVENVDPVFFDLSYVTIPADRSAYACRADYLSKSSEYPLLRDQDAAGDPLRQLAVKLGSISLPKHLS
jgi:hypothetical protein